MYHLFFRIFTTYIFIYYRFITLLIISGNFLPVNSQIADFYEYFLLFLCKFTKGDVRVLKIVQYICNKCLISAKFGSAFALYTGV